MTSENIGQLQRQGTLHSEYLLLTLYILSVLYTTNLCLIVMPEAYIYRNGNGCLDYLSAEIT